MPQLVLVLLSADLALVWCARSSSTSLILQSVLLLLSLSALARNLISRACMTGMFSAKVLHGGPQGSFKS